MPRSSNGCGWCRKPSAAFLAAAIDRYRCLAALTPAAANVLQFYQMEAALVRGQEG